MFRSHHKDRARRRRAPRGRRVGARRPRSPCPASSGPRTAAGQASEHRPDPDRRPDLQAADQRVMPNTKRLLVKQGTSFTDYIATTAQCCPSRASLLTGQYAHNHGVTSNRVGYPGLVDKGNVLPVWLQRAGYWTIHVGKFLNGYERFAKPDSDRGSRLGPVAHAFSGIRSTTTTTCSSTAASRHYGGAAGTTSRHVLNRGRGAHGRRYAPKGHPFYLQLDERAPHVATAARPVRALRPRRRSREPPTRDASRTCRCRSHRRSTRRT